MLAGVPLVELRNGKILHTSYPDFCEERKRRQKELEAKREADIAASMREGKRPRKEVELHITKKTKVAEPVGAGKLVNTAPADGCGASTRSAKSKVDLMKPLDYKLPEKPDLGGYWHAKYGDSITLESDIILNDIDEVIKQINTVQEMRIEYLAPSHVKFIKHKMMGAYNHICAIEADIAQNTANVAHMKTLNKELS